MAELFGLDEENERWNTQYEEVISKMWQELDIPEGTTASIFAYEGKTMYVMGYRNLSVVLNHEQGFEIPERVVEEVVNENESFLEVSEEVLSEYAGDYLFVIVADNDVDKQAAAELMDSAVWRSIPAVANKHMYFIDASCQDPSLPNNGRDLTRAHAFGKFSWRLPAL